MKKIITCLITICFCSCYNNPPTINLFEKNNDSTMVLHVTDALYNPDRTIEDMISKLEITILESNDLSLVSEINQIIINDEYIYIRDRFQNGGVVIFDINGKFVRRLTHGQAPEEIVIARSIFYDESTGYLYVYDDTSGKVLKLTKDGAFVSTSYIDGYISGLAAYNGKLYFAQSEIISGKSQLQIIETDSMMNCICKYDLGTDVYEYYSQSYFENCLKGFIVKKPWDNTIYSLKNDKWEKKIISDKYFSCNFSSYEGAHAMMRSIPDNVCVYSGICFQNRDWEVYRFFAKYYYVVNLFRNVKSGEMWTAWAVPNSFYNLISVMGMQQSEKNNIIGIIDPEYMTTGSKIPEYRWDGSNMNNLISPEDMEKLRNVKPDDNPIIVLFKLKDDI